MDEDLDTLSREQLIAEAVRLRHAHRRAGVAPVHARVIKYRQSPVAQAAEAPRTAKEFGYENAA